MPLCCGCSRFNERDCEGIEREIPDSDGRSMPLASRACFQVLESERRWRFFQRTKIFLKTFRKREIFG